MDTIGWILLLIVALCVVTILVLLKKRNDMEESEPYRPAYRGGSVTPIQPVEEIAEPEKGPLQVTMYEYRSAGNKCACILCDGENDPAATKCRICGCPLR